MAIFRCKMCGGDLEVHEGDSAVTCEFCGTQQTIPTVNDENLQGLFNRANVLRMKSEFDKAEVIYEKILQANEKEAEAYWGLILCKYGIEYVEDPATYKRIPTCHRTSFDAITADEDYKSALKYADVVQKNIYEAEAKAIDEIQKGILSISQQEAPYDVFICYKETDESGKRTVDSAIANDIYYQLVQEGFKVFYAAITLEDKLGTEYEPYIFSALNTSKVMLSLGTKPEYFNAVWVKNEWSRFLKIMKKDRSKLLIPCYRDMDAYELPEEFAHLQAQDMSKIGFINDIVRGIKKVIPVESAQSAAPHQNVTVVNSSASSNIENLLKRGNLALEDKKWDEAIGFFDRALDENAEEARAYFGMLLASYKCSTDDELWQRAEDWYKIKQCSEYEKAYRFGDDAYKKKLDELGFKWTYTMAQSYYQSNDINKIFDAAKLFIIINEYEDSMEMYCRCIEKFKMLKYEQAAELMTAAKSGDEYLKAKAAFEEISGYNDSDSKAAECGLKAKEANEAHYAKVVKLCQNGDYGNAVYNLHLAGENVEDSEHIFESITQYYASIRKKLPKGVIAAGEFHTIGLKLSGTVVVKGGNVFGECDVSDWTDIVAVAAGNYYTIGLKSDGTVVAKGIEIFGQCNVSDWTDIVAVAVGDAYTVGLKSDGTVATTEKHELYNVSDWTDIVAVAAENIDTIGLKSDGTVVTTGVKNVSSWTDIVAVAAGNDHTIGLKSDGTVVAAGNNEYGQCNVSDWTDIVAVAAGGNHTVGLRSSGTVIVTGNNDYGKCDVSDWTDIVAVATCNNYTIGLKSDGTVVATDYNQCDVSDWKIKTTND